MLKPILYAKAIDVAHGRWQLDVQLACNHGRRARRKEKMRRLDLWGTDSLRTEHDLLLGS